MVTNSKGVIFSNEKTQERINMLELKAALFGIKSLARDIHSTHAKILCDNLTAVACINKFGTSHYVKCNF